MEKAQPSGVMSRKYWSDTFPVEVSNPAVVCPARALITMVARYTSEENARLRNSATLKSLLFPVLAMLSCSIALVQLTATASWCTLCRRREIAIIQYCVMLTRL